MTANTEDLVQRCKDTNHEILDFDYQKTLYDKYFEMSKYPNKLTINTSEENMEEVIKKWIKEGRL